MHIIVTQAKPPLSIRDRLPTRRADSLDVSEHVTKIDTLLSGRRSANWDSRRHHDLRLTI
jgi:hypothetical protein